MAGAATTILFTDIEGSSVLLEELGDRRWLEVLRLHNAIVREQVAAFRGFEVKTVGDGFMVAFSAPEPAVACAVAIQRALAEQKDPSVKVRIGLHTGEAVREDDDFFGREVVMGARVSDRATGGEILVTDAVRSALSTPVELGAPRVVKLKGLSGTHRLHPVLWDGRSGTPSHLATAPDAPAHALVEREAQLQELFAALEGAAAGHGAGVAVAGPAGIGKSSLLQALGNEARRAGFPVLTALASEIERPFAYGIVRQLLEPTLRRLPDASFLETPAAQVLGLTDAEEPAAGYAILNALHRAVRELSAEAPLVLLVDDAHWGDEESLLWIGFMVRRVTDLPVLLVAAARDDEPEPPAALAGFFDSPEVALVSPRALSPAAVTRMVRAEHPEAGDGFASAVHRASGGIPLYVRELLAAARNAGISPDAAGARRLPDVTPGSIRRLMLGRLEPLGDAAGAIVRACAALDTHADLRSAARLAGLNPDEALVAADTLCQAGILQPGRPLTFTHPVMRAVVESQMSPFELSRHHAQAARMLDEEAAPIQEVAAHLLQSEPAEDDWVVDRLRAAAETALADGAPATAAEYLRRALREPPGSDELAGVLLGLARAERLTGHTEAAMDHARRALGRESDPVTRGRILAVLAQAMEAELLRPGTRLEWEHDGRPLVELIDETTARLPRTERELRWELEALAMGLLQTPWTMLSAPMPAADLERMARLAGEARGGTHGEREILGLYAGVQATTAGAHVSQVATLCRRALEDGAISRELGTGAPYGTAIEVLTACDEFTEAEHHLATAARHARRHGAPGSAALVAVQRGVNAWFAGRLDDALAFDAEVAEYLAESGPDAYTEAVAGGMACGVLLMRGELDAAERRALAIEHPRLRHHALGLVLAARGEHVAAVEHLRPAQEILDRRGVWRSGGPLRPVRPDLTLSLLSAGETIEARRTVSAELAMARAFGAPSAFALALSAQAQAFAYEAPLDEAAAIIRGAEARLVEAQILLDLGRMTGSAEALERAHGIAERRGARAISEPARLALERT